MRTTLESCWPDCIGTEDEKITYTFVIRLFSFEVGDFVDDPSQVTQVLNHSGWLKKIKADAVRDWCNSKITLPKRTKPAGYSQGVDDAILDAKKYADKLERGEI